MALNTNSSKQNKKTKRWLIWLFVVLAVLLIVSAILQALTPKSPKIPASQLNKGSVDEIGTQYQQLEFVGQYPSKPATLPVAQSSLTDLKPQLIPQLVSQFNLRKSDSGDLWLGDEFSFSLYDNQLELTRNYDQEQFQENEEKISLTEALATAQTFLSEYLPQYQVTPFTRNAFFLSKTDIQFERSLEKKADSRPEKEAEIIIIPFNYGLAGYPIYYQDNFLPFVELVIGSGEGVIKASINTWGLDYQTISEISVLDIDQVVLNIVQNNQAEIVFYGQEYVGNISFAEISSGKLTTVQLEYRIDPDNNLVYPFYRFEGEFVNDEGREFSAELIAPAVEVANE